MSSSSSQFSAKKKYKKKKLQQEFLESGLGAGEFFKEKFGKKSKRKDENKDEATFSSNERKGYQGQGRGRRRSFENKKDEVQKMYPGAIVQGRIIAIDYHGEGSDNEDTELVRVIYALCGSKKIFLTEGMPDGVEIDDNVAIKLTKIRKNQWEGMFIRIIPQTNVRVGVYLAKSKVIAPIHRKRDFPPVLYNGESVDELPLKDQMVILFEETQNGVLIKEKIGLISSPHSYSKVAAFHQDVWKPITKEEEYACKDFDIPALKDTKTGFMREDYRDLPLVTIDGADAKDFDDAVYAALDTDQKNQGGYRIVVAIADVAHYVYEGTLLDKKAKERGNSVYFPDFVVPMLPERLSNDLCSLRPGVDRACVVADMLITKTGQLKNATFKRALMKSHARLTYEEVEKAIVGKKKSKNIEPVFESTIQPLLEAYHLLQKVRSERGSLDIHSIEHEIIFTKDHHVEKIAVREQLISHQIIEEMMILANIAVARTLKNRDYPCMYRVHPKPDRLKVQNLQLFSKFLKLPKLKSDQPTPHEFNELLNSVKKGSYESLVNDLVLRCQAQAIYSGENQGHYGLGLLDYCHFTSPIRRYADLITHRLLIDLLKLGDGGDRPLSLSMTSEHISKTERQASAAEYEAKERFLADYLQQHKGDVFDAIIVGVNQAGLFVELSSVYAEAFIPKRFLFELSSRDSSYYDRALHRLRVGENSYQLGLKLKVKLLEADPISCQVIATVVAEKKDDKKTEKKTRRKKT